MRVSVKANRRTVVIGLAPPGRECHFLAVVVRVVTRRRASPVLALKMACKPPGDQLLHLLDAPSTVCPIVAPPTVRPPSELRLAELMAALSLAIDLGNGYPLEKALRDALLAIGLAKELGLEGQDLSDVYYLALLEHLGCTAGSHELADAFGGDDNGLPPNGADGRRSPAP